MLRAEESSLTQKVVENVSYNDPRVKWWGINRARAYNCS